MRTVRSLSRQSISSAAAILALVGLLIPSALPAFASADTLSTRSVNMSTSAAGATGVDYDITFTPSASSAKSVVIDFCNAATGAVIPSACTAPTGLNVSSATLGTNTTSGLFGTAAINATDTTDGHIVIGGATAHAAATPIEIELDGVANPTTAATFYARIYTYSEEDPQATGDVQWTSADDLGDAVDTGAVALSTTTSTSVSAYIPETMTFCVSAAAPAEDCASTTSPNVTLGSTTTGLSTTTPDTGTVYAQLSTNAVSGAVVDLKNSNSCGGLKIVDSSNCDIAPWTTTGSNWTAGTAYFGLELGTATQPSGAAAGTYFGSLEAASGSDYNATDYYMDYSSANPTTEGVTSTYGSPLLDTGDTSTSTDPGPVSNMNMPITFAASAANNTPAGNYSATLDMIATGTY